VDFNLLCWKFN